jgi:hypothetical protein
MSPGAAALTAGELQSSPVPAPIHDDSLRSDSPSTKRAKFQQPKHIDIASSNDGGKDVGQSLEDLKEPVVDLTDGAESPPHPMPPNLQLLRVMLQPKSFAM